jgi:hypothetical protein
VRLYAVNPNTRSVTLRSTLTPYPNFRGGVSVAATEVLHLDGVNVLLLTAPGPDVRAYDAATFQPEFRFNAFDPTFLGGVNVAGSG